MRKFLIIVFICVCVHAYDDVNVSRLVSVYDGDTKVKDWCY